MVSNASEDLPEPDRPVITVKRSRGISTLMFFRLCWRAPLTLMRSMAIAKTRHSNGQIFTSQVWSAVDWQRYGQSADNSAHTPGRFARKVCVCEKLLTQSRKGAKR